VAPFSRSLSVSMGTQSALSTAYVIRQNGVMSKSTSLTTNTCTSFMSKVHFSAVHFDAEKQRCALLSEQPSNFLPQYQETIRYMAVQLTEALCYKLEGRRFSS